jgi:hypothetical protein
MIPSVTGNERLQKRISELTFCSLEDVHIANITWNVNGKLETVENLAKLLRFDGTPKHPDIIVVNLQEIIELSAQSGIMYF